MKKINCYRLTSRNSIYQPQIDLSFTFDLNGKVSFTSGCFIVSKSRQTVKSDRSMVTNCLQSLFGYIFDRNSLTIT